MRLNLLMDAHRAWRGPCGPHAAAAQSRPPAVQQPPPAQPQHGVPQRTPTPPPSQPAPQVDPGAASSFTPHTPGPLHGKRGGAKHGYTELCVINGEHLRLCPPAQAVQREASSQPQALVPRRAPAPVLVLAPLALTHAQEVEQRRSALQRILAAAAFPAQRLRASLLASLATR